jgi:hypothetical protein
LAVITAYANSNTNTVPTADTTKPPASKA